MIRKILGNEKGMALISVYLASAVIATLAGAVYSKSFFEMKQVDRELARLRSFAAAEAGIQNSMAQISVNAYTGFINTAPISVTNFQSVSGSSVGSYSVTLNYPNQADWVIVTSTATVDGDTRTLEARIFLDSNLSKYLVYADAPDFGSGTNAQYGEPDTTDVLGDGIPDYPELVPANESDRAALYFTGSWTISGSGVQLYGDANAVTQINGNSSSEIHGDAYTGAFNLSGTTVTNSGVTGSLVVGDGFADDIDRNNSGSITALDYPDYHDLNSTGGGDSHKTETLVQIDNNFYKNNNNISAFGGTTAANRYLQFVSTNNGTTTQVVEYTSSAYQTVANTYNLPSSAIVYVNGNVTVKGEIGGRVSVVASNSINFDGNVTYSNGQTTADASHSAAFMAKDKLYFRANNLAVSGILKADNSSNSSASFDSDYNTNGQYSPSTKNTLNLKGNRIVKGATNLSNYPNRTYGYDANLKYFRPPGIPVVPSLKTVREK